MRERRGAGAVNTGTIPVPGDPRLAFFVDAIRFLESIDVPFLIGGAFAHSRYTGRERETKDLDIMLRREAVPRVLDAFERAGYQTELRFPHWLAKVQRNHQYIDVVFSSGNGVVYVDEDWFAHAEPADVLGIPVAICPAEELLWSSAFVQERERYDGAAVLHLLHARAATLDWERLLKRFDEHWPVLLSCLVLFQFAYPNRRDDLPRHVLTDLTLRLLEQAAEPDNRGCFGTLLSREQYLYDLEKLGYADARVHPFGRMTPHEAEVWTKAIGERR